MAPREAPHLTLAAGAIYLVVGLAAGLIALDFPIGTARRMGPGALPLLVSGLLTLSGLVLAVSGLRAGALEGLRTLSVDRRTVRAVGSILAALTAFALLIRPGGLFLAAVASTFLATRAEGEQSLAGGIILAVCVASAATAIFIWGIGLPIRVGPGSFADFRFWG